MTDTIVEPDPAPAVAPRPRSTRIIRGIGWASLISGLLILGFVVQQLFVTTWLADRNQENLAAEAADYFDTAQITPVPVSEVEFLAPGAPALVDPDDPNAPPEPVLLVEAPPEKGKPFAIIRIPKIEKLRDGWTVVEGVSVRDLKNGAGHMPHTPLPGQPGNAVISGHRTTYGAPFFDLDTLVPGDRIEVETALGTHVYAVRETIIVEPTDLWVTEPREGAWLTLTTCNPRFSSRQRLIVFAEMVEGPNMAAIYR